jgi:acyl dehydratase
MDVRFVRGVKAGETLRAEAVVTARTEEGEAVRFAFDVQCGNEDGQAGLVGTATGVIR